ncbi:PilW family protein [Zoogloea sp.]|uniref:PilW family protein n=1 Tax=Zoogloea sp. TaxID=49181 RepID=UPI0035B4AEB6
MNIQRSRPTARPSRARGLTLVELMIALVLGMILIGGVLVVFLGSQQSFSTSDNLSKMQDSARIAFSLMAQEVREASSTGCGNGSRADNAIAKRNESILNAAQSASPAWWSVMGNGVQGYDANVAAPAVSIGTGLAARTSTTDAIQLAGAYGASYGIDAHDNIGNQFTLNTSTPGIAANDVLIACDYKQSTIFRSTGLATNKVSYSAGAATNDNCGTALGYDTTNTCSTISYKYDSLVSRLSRFKASTWYVGTGTNGRPSLYRVFLNGTPEEIAPGVSDMQITYLQIGNPIYADAVDISDWTQVISVRITLTFESQSANVSTATTGDRRLTTVATDTIMLRNRTP